MLAHIDPETGEPRELSHYARLVQRARSERLAIDGRSIDWVLVRNRISMLSSRNMRQVQSTLDKIAARLGCRVADGIAERVIFRSLFPTGMTVFDPLSEDLLGGVPSMSHMRRGRNIASWSRRCTCQPRTEAPWTWRQAPCLSSPKRPSGRCRWRSGATSLTDVKSGRKILRTPVLPEGMGVGSHLSLSAAR